MSFHYWLNQRPARKTRFIALSGSYHGETLGALSVSDVALYRKTYAPLLLTRSWRPRRTPTRPNRGTTPQDRHAADWLGAAWHAGAADAHETAR